MNDSNDGHQTVHSQINLTSFFFFFSSEQLDTQVNIENEINVTVIFPDKDNTNKNTGGFETPEKFREFLCSHQNKRVEHTFFSRPTKDRKQDYLQDEFVASLILQYPYGYGGLPNQTILQAFRKKHKKHLSFTESLKMVLRHRRKEFHVSDFTLFVNDRIMKQSVYASARLHCNLKYKDAQPMGEKYGTISSDQLEMSINRVRANSTLNPSTNPSDAFLRSVNAACSNLPHTNEACSDARDKYFSNIIKFGLPALFVTISPDDQRSVWISVYALDETETSWTSEPTTSNHSDRTLIAKFEKRCKNRTDYPGLCAESYMAIMESFIRDVLQWDEDQNCAAGEGLFGFTEAFTLATEEQGRKSLHGHFLIWIRFWNMLLHRIMEQHRFSPAQQQADLARLRTYIQHCSSATLFQDFGANQMFSEHAVFSHSECRTIRQNTQCRFTVNPVDETQLAQMRHKRKCFDHLGHIATCPKCSKKFGLHEIVANSLNFVDPLNEFKYAFPDHTKRLDSLVYEMEKDFNWWAGPPQKKARRLFVSNVHSNLHYVTHSTRCFKKESSCYASLPRNPSLKMGITFSRDKSIWVDWHGRQHEKHIFDTELLRPIEDAYTNTHNAELSRLYLCNNNVATAMTGASVFYCTAYNTKKTQKEEKQAYDNMAKTLIAVLRKQEENPDLNAGLITTQLGFRRLLMGIYRHTNSLVIAGPMAHYLALTESRYRFSHEHEYVPIRGLSRILKGETCAMYLTRVDQDRQVPFCRALNYILRPKEFESMSPYCFFSKIRVIKMSELESQHECFNFEENHPKHKISTCVYHKHARIPNIDWTFFGDAKLLKKPLLEPSNSTNYVFSDYDEEYARKYLLAFVAYRKESNLTRYNSYTKRICHAYNIGELTDHLDTMQNIQNIRNSLDAGRMKDNMACCEKDPEKINATPDNDEEDSDYMNLISTYFASTTNNTILDSEPDIFDFEKGDFSNSGCDNGDIWEDGPQSVFVEMVHSEEDTSDEPIRTSRQYASLYGMNSLLQQSFLMASDENDINRRLVVTNGSAESIIAFGLSRGLDLDQQTAFEILTSTFVLSYVEDVYLSHKSANELLPSEAFRNLAKARYDMQKMAQIEYRKDKPLRMFITGPAGAGKSKILNSLMDYARGYVTQLDGFRFDEGIIRLTALTGSAATEIKGSTVHRTCKVSKGTSKISSEDIDSWLNTRLLIIDEISFADHKNLLTKISQNLQRLTSSHDDMYGSVPICFIGDFQQLEPVGGNPAYMFPGSIYWENALNCMVELEGTWRFSECPKMTEAFPIIRRQGLTPEIIAMFNERVINNQTVKMPDIRFTKVVTYSNKKRQSANRCIFDEHIEKYHSKSDTYEIPTFSVIVKSDMRWSRNHIPLTFTERKGVFSKCDETDVTLVGDSNKRCDPFLRLFYKMQLMYTDNLDVDNGVANGTTAVFENLVMKAGRRPHKIRYNGYWIFAVNAEDVKFMRLRWADSTFKGTFKIQPSWRKYNVQMTVQEFGSQVKITPKIGMHQFLVTTNHATTGHKLQGKTVTSLIVREWSKTKNWLYVVLSRVKTIEGLFLMEPIPSGIDTKPPQELIQMLDRLRNTIKAKPDEQTISRIREKTLLNVRNCTLENDEE